MILYRDFVVFRRSRKSYTPKIKCLSFLSVHYYFCFLTAHRQVSVHQGRISIHKEKEKAGITGVVSSKGLFCSSVRLGVDVLCSKGQFA